MEVKMSKYVPLKRHLSASGTVNVVRTFAQIERILGFSLPTSARQYPAWWSNDDSGSRHVQAHAWRDAGYRTEQVDLNSGKVTFVKVQDHQSSTSAGPATPRKVDGARHSLIGSMKGTTVVMAGIDLTEPAAPEWGEIDNA